MKILLMILLLFCSGSYLHAQTMGSVYVAVGAGVSSPVGNFASTEKDNPKAGYAITGFHFYILGLYKLNRTFGVGGILTGNVNGVDNYAYQHEAAEEFPSLTGWQVNSKKWSNGGILAGLVAMIPLGSRIDMDLKAFVGGMLVSSPEVEIISSYNNTAQYIKQYEQDKTGAFAFDVGIGFRIPLQNKAYLSLNADYTLAFAHFNDVRTLEWADPNEDPEIITTSFSQNVQTLNITLGIGYYIN
jgi:hypothetical protein